MHVVCNYTNADAYIHNMHVYAYTHTSNQKKRDIYIYHYNYIYISRATMQTPP